MTTKTTTRLRLSLLDRWRVHAARYHSAVVGMALIAVLLFARQLLSGGSAPSAVAVPTPALPAPIIIVATQAAIVPTAVPPAAQVAAVVPNALRRAVVAYDAPAGNVIGAIDQGRAYQVMARFGSDWLQADVAGSGIVWLRADQVLDLPAGLADLEPPPAPVVIDRPIYVNAPAPAVDTPAAPYTVASEPLPTMPPQQAAIYDRQQWAMDAQQAGR